MTPSGDVLDRTGISEQAVRYHTVPLRDGRTIYGRIGELPIVAAAILVLVVGLLLAGRDRRRRGRAGDTGPDADATENDARADGHAAAAAAGEAEAVDDPSGVSRR